MTLPLDPATVAALKEDNQAGYLALLKQWQDTPQFFCCISGNTVGVAKDPVPILTIPDRVTCIGVNFTVSFALSWSPTASLAGTAYTLRWGDGSPPVNGNFPNPRNPALEVATKVGGYATVGHYDITIDVTDTLGATSSTRLQVYARDCTQPPNPLPFPVASTYSHPVWHAQGGIVLSDTQAWYTIDIDTGVPPGCAWTRFNDFASFTPTEVHDAMLELDSGGNEYLYVADYDRIWMHPMPPNVGNWTALATADQMATLAGVDISTHTCWLECLAIDILHDGWQWVTWVAQRTWPHAVDHIVGVAHTRDGWNSLYLSSEVTRVVYNAAWTQECRIYGIDINHDDPATVYAVVGWVNNSGVDEESRLYRSINYGATWSNIDTISTWGRHGDVWVPYAGNGAYVYWANRDRMRMSSGGGFGTVYNHGGANAFCIVRLTGPIDRTDTCLGMFDHQLWEYRNGANVHITPDMAGGSGFADAVWCRARNAAGNATEVIWAGGSGGASRVKQNTGGVQNDKDTNWVDPIPWAIGWPELREYST